MHFDPREPDQRKDPFEVYRRLRHEEPVHHAKQFDLWVISRYEDVVAVARQPESFSSQHAVRSSMAPLPDAVHVELQRGYPPQPMLTDSDEPQHRRLRTLVSQAFTPSFIKTLEPRLEQLANQLISTFRDDGSADLIEVFAWPYPLSAIAMMLGIEDANLRDLHVWSDHWLKMNQAVESVELHTAYAQSFVALQHFVMDQLQNRASHPGDDLLSALLEAELDDGSRLSLEEALWVPLNLIVAGHMTVTRALGSALLRILQSETIRDELIADLDTTLELAVEEFLRLDSPAQGMFRTALEDVTINGVTIPAGGRVMILFGSANRDESRCPAPDTFDMTRPDIRRHIAFGTGIHVCIGAPLARLELQIALRLLLEQLPGLRLVGTPERETLFFARGLTTLPVQWGHAS